jgi:hypothetical protein
MVADFHINCVYKEIVEFVERPMRKRTFQNIDDGLQQDNGPDQQLIRLKFSHQTINQKIMNDTNHYFVCGYGGDGTHFFILFIFFISFLWVMSMHHHITS